MFLLGNCFLIALCDFNIVHLGLLFFLRKIGDNRLKRLPKDIFQNLSTLQQL